ncbi:GAF domain-containing protein [Clavibacter michiganensis]|uniref:GAF domain-containing protein n=1 Tax=Clavibacter michiganensis TaxID=28447 RepID=UPI003EC07B8F
MSVSPEDVFAEVERRIARDPGVRLFTVLQWIPAIRTLRRVASNRPAEYPLGAEKSLEVSGGWLDAVIRDRRTFLGAHDADVAAVFADVELIRSLGCGSVINAPIVSDDRVVGVLAILDADGAYDAAAVATVERHAADLSAELGAALGADLPAATPTPFTAPTPTAEESA